jgi:uncharacterized membrane protein YcaP (DUF421 family)
MSIGDLFHVRVSPVELIVRGTFIYWFLFAMFRFVLRRDAGGVGIADILLVVLIADASQNAMAGGYDSVAEGCVLVSTLIGWNYLVDWASFRWAAVRRLAEPTPLLLIDRGRVLARNLRREFITRDELEAQLRLNGVGSLSDVRKAFFESDGRFSIVRCDAKRENSNQDSRIQVRDRVEMNPPVSGPRHTRQEAGPEALGPDCAPGFAGFFSAGGDIVGPEAPLAAASGPDCAPDLAGVFCAGGVGLESVCARANCAPAARASAAAAARGISVAARRENIACSFDVGPDDVATGMPTAAHEGKRARSVSRRTIGRSRHDAANRTSVRPPIA